MSSFVGDIDDQYTHKIGNQSKGKMLKSHIQILSKREINSKNGVSEYLIPNISTYKKVEKTRTMSKKANYSEKLFRDIRFNCGKDTRDKQQSLETNNRSTFIIEKTCKICYNFYKVPSKTQKTHGLDKELCDKCRNAPVVNPVIIDPINLQRTDNSEKVLCYKCWNELVANPEIRILIEIQITHNFDIKFCNRCGIRLLVAPKIIIIDSDSNCSEILLLKAMADQNRVIDVSKEIDEPIV
ncbi:hypothetical protein COBT_000456 [Conglomerata obtusa]